MFSSGSPAPFHACGVDCAGEKEKQAEPSAVSFARNARCLNTDDAMHNAAWGKTRSVRPSRRRCSPPALPRPSTRTRQFQGSPARTCRPGPSRSLPVPPRPSTRAESTAHPRVHVTRSRRNHIDGASSGRKSTPTSKSSNVFSSGTNSPHSCFPAAGSSGFKSSSASCCSLPLDEDKAACLCFAAYCSWAIAAESPPVNTHGCPFAADRRSTGALCGDENTTHAATSVAAASTAKTAWPLDRAARLGTATAANVFPVSIGPAPCIPPLQTKPRRERKHNIRTREHNVRWRVASMMKGRGGNSFITLPAYLQRRGVTFYLADFVTVR
eukprot:1148783-Rhodomonas_salina.1